MNIIIFSKDCDNSTNQVIDWLTWHAHTPIRINHYSDFFQLFNRVGIDNNNISFIHNLKSEFGIWYRRRGVLAGTSELDYIDTETHYHLKEELLSLFQFCFDELEESSKISLGSKNGSRINKLLVLKHARKSGLKIPNTLITNQKNILTEFLKKQDSLITKPISEATMFMSKLQERHVMYTEEYAEDENTETEPIFFPSLFQKNISKKIDIRTYYLNGVCYSMAIFSQQSEMSRTDFRVYDTVNKVRNVPYKLPKEIEKKIVMLMKSLALSEGSLDFIQTTDDEIIFLEVNPAGQFGMVSKPCNYYLEEKIALYFNGKQ